MAHAEPKRNDPCPCGSGKKYKKCCLGQPGGGAAAVATDPRRALDRAQRAMAQSAFTDAVAAFEIVCRAQPTFAGAQLGRVHALCRAGRMDEGVAAFDALPPALQREAGLVALGGQLLDDRRPADALRIADRAVAIDPDAAHLDALIATCAERLHDAERAVHHARRAVDRAPDDPTTRLLAARLEAHHGDAARAEVDLRGLGDDDAIADDVRGRALLELGRLLDRRGAYADVFPVLDAAGRARRRSARGIDLDAVFARLDANRRGFIDGDAPQWNADELADDRRAPAFLVGFLRSGTTMLEQVLSAHPAIVTGDELPLIGAMKRELAERVPDATTVPERLAALDVDGARAVRARFWQEAEHHLGRPLGEVCFVDKTALNTIDVGLIDAIFPDARLLVARRDPRDICLSCYMQPFSLNDFTVQFTSWERTARLYRAVMSYWHDIRDRLRTPWLEVTYADTVADLPAQSRRVLDHLGVPWDDGVLAFHEHARTKYVSTPSFADVAQPIYTRALDRWRHYPEPMAQLTTWLGDDLI